MASICLRRQEGRLGQGNPCWETVPSHFSSATMSDPLNSFLGVKGYHFHFKMRTGPGVVAQTCNPSAWEAETDQVPGQPELHGDTLSPKGKQTNKAGGCFIGKH